MFSHTAMPQFNATCEQRKCMHRRSMEKPSLTMSISWSRRCDSLLVATAASALLTHQGLCTERFNTHACSQIFPKLVKKLPPDKTAGKTGWRLWAFVGEEAVADPFPEVGTPATGPSKPVNPRADQSPVLLPGQAPPAPASWQGDQQPVLRERIRCLEIINMSLIGRTQALEADLSHSQSL